MSQLRQVAPASSGQPAVSLKLSWSDFVHLVLGVTVQAYQIMRHARIVEHDWEENIFTLCLGEDYIRPLTFDQDLPLRVSVRTKTHTVAMKAGQQNTIEAKEIDLQIFDIWEREYHQKHFVWEAKRVADKRNNPAYSNLNSEYVNEAIYRFIRCEYADGLDDAGVLAYVLVGDVMTIVDDINQSMALIRKNPALSTSNNLCPSQAIADFKDIYHSKHRRIDSTDIQLHHLFLTFDFD